MLAKLLGAIDKQEFRSVVYSMMHLGPVSDLIRNQGIEVYSLGMKQGTPDPRAVLRLARAVRKWKPDIIQTWMYHADLLGGIVGKLCGNVPVVWNIRHSGLFTLSDSRSTFRVGQLCARLSRWLPSGIISCAESARRSHAELGYANEKMKVIPNGFDLNRFRPRPDAGRFCLKHFGIPETVRFICLVGRFDHQKDHQTFFAAAGKFHARCSDVLFVACGEWIDYCNPALVAMIEQAGVRENTLLLGRRTPDEIANLMSRSTVFTSSSRGEGFPNVIGEAMGCGAICVVTDAGDSAHIVGDTGCVVPRETPQALADSWIQAIELPEGERKKASAASRRRIEQNFTIQTAALRYRDYYIETAKKSRTGQ